MMACDWPAVLGMCGIWKAFFLSAKSRQARQTWFFFVLLPGVRLTLLGSSWVGRGSSVRLQPEIVQQSLAIAQVFTSTLESQV